MLGTPERSTGPLLPFLTLSSVSKRRSPSRRDIRKCLFFAAIACAVRPTNGVLWVYLFGRLAWALRDRIPTLRVVVTDALLIGLASRRSYLARSSHLSQLRHISHYCCHGQLILRQTYIRALQFPPHQPIFRVIVLRNESMALLSLAGTSYPMYNSLPICHAWRMASRAR